MHSNWLLSNRHIYISTSTLTQHSLGQRPLGSGCVGGWIWAR